MSLGVKKKYMYAKNTDLYITCNYAKYSKKGQAHSIVFKVEEGGGCENDKLWQLGLIKKSHKS